MSRQSKGDKLQFEPSVRRRIMARQHPKIRGKGECPVEVGDVIDLTGRVAIRVDRIRIPKGGGWSLAYTRIDNRVLYLMPSGHRTDLDEKGRPKPMSQAEEHGMNSNPKDPVGAGEVLVGAEYQTVVKMPSRLKNAERERKEHAERELERDLQRLNAELKELAKRGVKMGIDPMELIAPVAAKIQEQHRAMSERAA